ncbi:AAA family ATPase [Pararobbsia alpina]|nr:ATP-binding protein [Pararobbsia alpina]
MTASKDKEKRDANTVETGITSLPTLVRSAVIYGPNASGKSALIMAMQFAQIAVRTSASLMPGQPLNQAPFKLDAKTSAQPSEFEFTFLLQGIRYQYGFALLPDGIHEEWLLVYKASKPQVWFERKFDKKTEADVYHFGSSFVGTRKVWQQATRRNALFLSTAIQLNSESLRPVYDWIVERLVVFGAGSQPPFEQSTSWASSAVEKPALLAFLGAADVGIFDVSVHKRKQHMLRFEVSDGEPRHAVSEAEVNFPVFLHKGPGGEAAFQMEEESAGTQRLFAFAAPLIEALNAARVIVVDELDSSLHSYIVRFLVELFHRPAGSSTAAQLIFTTHDTSLLDANIFRRDQVWFMEKNREHASVLVPLTDFSPRKHEALERGYLQGRYGALPLTSDFVPGEKPLGT